MFSHVFVAGTFDGLHKGHEALLRRAFAEGQQVTIGLTSEEFVKKYKVHQFASQGYAGYVPRLERLEQWLAEQQLTGKATIIPIDDPYEPAASGQFDALVVTVENKHRGEDINHMRQAKGLPVLTLLEVPLVSAEDGGTISSTRIRQGGIDASGRLVMPASLRSALGKPLGPVLNGEEITKSLAHHHRQLVVTVGDVATKTLVSASRPPALAIIDRKVGRVPYHELDTFIETSGADVRKITSGPGFIAGQAVKEIKDWGREITRAVLKQRILVIEGEEDLLTLPAMAYAPLGSVVYYGQPNQGLVEVEVTLAKQEEAIALLNQFT